MRCLLDATVISNVTKPIPSQSLLTWMTEQGAEDPFIASLAVAEIRRGVLEKPAGQQRDRLGAWFAGSEGPQALFAGRVLSFDEAAGLVWARLMADGNATGRPRSALDAIVAAVAEANNCIVVTDNEGFRRRRDGQPSAGNRLMSSFRAIDAAFPIRPSACCGPSPARCKMPCQVRRR